MPEHLHEAEPSLVYTITCGAPPALQVYELQTGTRRMMLPDRSVVDLTDTQYRFLHLMVKNSTEFRLFSLSLLLDEVWPDRPKTGKSNYNIIHRNITDLRNKHIWCIENHRGAYAIAGQVKIKEPKFLEQAGGIAPRLDPELTFYNMIVAILLTVMVTTSITAIVRGVLTQARLTITQAPAFGFALGLLQGVAGALIWSVPLAIVFLHRWFRSGETYGSWSRALQSRSAAASMLALSGAVGFAGGLVIDILVMFAQQPVSLQQAGWTDAGRSSPWTIFTVSHLGWAEPILGLVVCLACTATLQVILRLRPWQEWLQEQQPRLDIRQMASMLLSVGKLFGMWPLAFVAGPVLAVSAASFGLLGSLQKTDQIVR